MALALQGAHKPSINWGLVTKIEIRQQGTGSFQNVGRYMGLTGNIAPLAKKGDPAGTMYVYAYRISISFTLIQTATAKEITTMLGGTAGTGLAETDVEVKLTFVGGRTLTLGAVSGSPLRLAATYEPGDETGSQRIVCQGENIEPITAIVAKFG